MNKSLLSLLLISSFISASNTQRLATQQSPEDQRILQVIRDYNKAERKKNKKDYSTLKIVGISMATAMLTSMPCTLVMFKLTNQ